MFTRGTFTRGTFVKERLHTSNALVRVGFKSTESSSDKMNVMYLALNLSHKLSDGGGQVHFGASITATSSIRNHYLCHMPPTCESSSLRCRKSFANVISNEVKIRPNTTGESEQQHINLI